MGQNILPSPVSRSLDLPCACALWIRNAHAHAHADEGRETGDGRRKKASRRNFFLGLSAKRSTGQQTRVPFPKVVDTFPKSG